MTLNLSSGFARQKVLIIGDLMLDRYLWGKVERISPEAPVPVVDVLKEENRLGGAANVAKNIIGLGGQVFLLGAVGGDAAGADLTHLLRSSGINTDFIVVNPNIRTTSKIRIIGNNQQILRIDKEDILPYDDRIINQLSDYLQLALSQGITSVIIEDYNKGLLTKSFIKAILSQTPKSVPIFVDPKFTNFLEFAGVTLFKPNLKELNTAFNLQLDKSDLSGLRAVISQLRQKMPHGYTLVTLSEMGVLLADPNLEILHIPAWSRQIRDVSGAGDTVIAVMAMAYGIGLSMHDAAKIANLAGGLVCEVPGVHPIDLTSLLSEIDFRKIQLTANTK